MAQETGYVNEYAEAILTIKTPTGTSIKCVLDTGFNGFLLLPRWFIKNNSFNFFGYEEVMMVEKNMLEVEIASGEIYWLDQSILVKVLVSETEEALLGTQLLIDTRLEIDYKNSIVKITT